MVIGTIKAFLKPEKKVESIDEKRAKARAKLEGLNYPPEIIDRLVILETYSGFNDDSREIMQWTDYVRMAIEKKNPKFRLTPEQIAENELAALLHDIGKSSASDDPAAQEAVVELFSKNNIEKRESVKVDTILEREFPEEKAGKMKTDLKKAHVESDKMTMLEFHDMHAPATKTILEKYFNERVVTIAASHHLYRGIDPCGIIGKELSEDMKYSIYILMAIDVYQALIDKERGNSEHEVAMNRLGTILKEYANDPIMRDILQVIDELGRTGKLRHST